jgi:hypothetical protein
MKLSEKIGTQLENKVYIPSGVAVFKIGMAIKLIDPKSCTYPSDLCPYLFGSTQK